MADVIPLAPHRRSQPPKVLAASRQGTGTILFFTGVRYERQDEPAPAEPTVQGRPRALTSSPASGPKRPKKATRARQPA